MLNSYWCLFTIFALIVTGLVLEALFHRQQLSKIRIRIHVNGTRGKSSVTRLIAAGLRAGGLTVAAKTTGTLASFIFPNGQEEPIFRVGHTNIIEQIKIVRRAAKLGVDALVIECMAVQPLLQALCEAKLVRSTHGVLTNARPDHLDVMGPTPQDVALALAGTMPIRGEFFTSAQQYVAIFAMAAQDRKTHFHALSEAQINQVSDADLAGFAYTEYKDNVALALAVCSSLGINREQALAGMWAAIPDPGALTVYTIQHQDHTITFVNGFAANDPVSTDTLWHKMRERYKDYPDAILLMNCRADRKQRSVQMAEAMQTWLAPSRSLAIGQYTQAFVDSCNKAVPICDGEGFDIKDILNYVVDSTDRYHLLVGVGNIAGIGFKCVDYFREHQDA